MNKKTLIIAFIVIVAAFAVMYVYGRKPTTSYANLDQFAQCLASKGATMYGAAWCPHCKNEKARFGSSFQYVPYVECPENEQLCLSKGVRGYPTWILGDGTLLEGEQGLERLSQATGCELVK